MKIDFFFPLRLIKAYSADSLEERRSIWLLVVVLLTVSGCCLLGEQNGFN
jgi:hypothetical protein